MERKTTKQPVPTTDRDVPAAGNPKQPWTKPEIRIMRVDFTAGGPNPTPSNIEGAFYTPS